MMTEKKPTYNELEARLKKAEHVINAIRQKDPDFAEKISMLMKHKEIENEMTDLNRALENRMEKRTVELAKKTRRLRLLTNKLICVERDERNKLSGILHDHIQPLVVGARMQVWDIQRKTGDASVKKTADKIERILVETLETLRSLSVELSPAALQNNGLIGGLNWLKTYMAKNFDFNVNMSVAGEIEPIKEETCFLLFEGVKELLLNAAKHAEVEVADLMIRRTDENLISIVVADQGRGFDPALNKNSKRDMATLGLFNIQERLLSIDGRMIIETAVGRGTKTTLTAPAGIEAGAFTEQQAGLKKEKHNELANSIKNNKEMIGILIVDDHKVLREGLKGLLQAEPDFHILGEASSGRAALEMARELLPDVILMDINLGDMHGLQVTQKIMSDQPQTRIIGLSIHDDPSLMSAMYSAGAVNYLTKNTDSEKIISSIRSSMSPK